MSRVDELFGDAPPPPPEDPLRPVRRLLLLAFLLDGLAGAVFVFEVVWVLVTGALSPVVWLGLLTAPAAVFTLYVWQRGDELVQRAEAEGDGVLARAAGRVRRLTLVVLLFCMMSLLVQLSAVSSFLAYLMGDGTGSG